MLNIAQIIVSIILVILILLQERSSGLSGALGSSSPGTPYQKRRGMENFIYWGTIVFSVIFVGLAIVTLIL